MAQESEAFPTRDLYKQAKQENLTYLKFLDNDQLSSGIYQLAVGEEDKQDSHKWDEAYYILEGEGKIGSWR